MMKDYSNQDLQGCSFRNSDFSDAIFMGSDLRGADFSGCNLAGADFTKARTGIKSVHVALLFAAALGVSMFSGYMAMLAGHTIQQMLASKDPLIHAAGIATIVLTVLFILAFYLKGVGNTFFTLILPTCAIALAIGLTGYLTGVGTGMGMVYLVLTVFLVTIMFVVGTISRATAGTLSSAILFIAVAMGGGMFGKSLGGGIGTVIMALSCAKLSKRALSGARGFESTRKIAFFATRKLGTSFRGTDLSGADFSGAKLHNADFSGADVTSASWSDAKMANCISGLDKFTIKI
jgi:uncharacterized protein YjbI with pentapeptide repeats/Na+-transporting methylmalonyl-CoA/oxaloacetate decarboxylase gamma subunit